MGNKGWYISVLVSNEDEGGYSAHLVGDTEHHEKKCKLDSTFTASFTDWTFCLCKST